MGGRNFEEEFGQALFFVSPSPHYVLRETKIEPDRRLQFLFQANLACFNKIHQNVNDLVFRDKVE